MYSCAVKQAPRYFHLQGEVEGAGEGAGEEVKRSTKGEAESSTKSDWQPAPVNRLVLVPSACGWCVVIEPG